MKYIFTNLLGTFVLDNNLNLVEQIRFKSPADYQNKNKTEQKFKNKYKDWRQPEGKKLIKILALFKNKQFFPEFYQQNLALTKEKIKASVTDDLLIIQTISNISELDKICNILTKRLREWYELYLPEFSKSVQNNQAFARLVREKTKKDLLKELKLKKTMGADLKKEDIKEILFLAEQISHLHLLRQKHEKYLKTLMQKLCPNLLELTGATLGAKLLQLAGSLKRLATLPSSTVQLLGAEKALFRHIKTGAKPPRHGLILQHPLVSQAKKQDRGKVARALADKISLAARIDFFKGEFRGKQLKKELEERFK